MFGEFYSTPPFASDGFVYEPQRFPVRPGDLITATVTRVDGGLYRLRERNQTRNWTYTTTGRSPDYSPSSDPGNRSAEVVMEQPGNDLPRYPTLTFTSVSYTSQNNGSYSLARLRTIDDNGVATQTPVPTPLGQVVTQWRRRG